MTDLPGTKKTERSCAPFLVLWLIAAISILIRRTVDDMLRSLRGQLAASASRRAAHTWSTCASVITPE